MCVLIVCKAILGCQLVHTLMMSMSVLLCSKTHSQGVEEFKQTGVHKYHKSTVKELQEYHTNWQHFVSISGATSSLLPIYSGVPQGRIYAYPWSSDRESWLSSRLIWCLNRCLGQWSYSQYCQCSYVIATWVSAPYMLPVRTDFCCCMMANLSSGMCLLFKGDINN